MTSPRPRRAQRGQGERGKGEGQNNGYQSLAGAICRRLSDTRQLVMHGLPLFPFAFRAGGAQHVHDVGVPSFLGGVQCRSASKFALGHSSIDIGAAGDE